MIDKTQKISKEQALPGRDQEMPLEPKHAVNGHSMKPPFSNNGKSLEQIVLGLGCFWGAERKFWQLDGVYVTAAGYAAGHTINPSYEEVCSGLTGHNEVVLVVFDPELISLQDILTVFWEAHNPTQGMRQGNDIGTQYRSGIYTFHQEQQQVAKESLEHYQAKLTGSGFSAVTTEIEPVGPFYYAEQYHQQYLHKNPMGYCGLGGTGVCF